MQSCILDALHTYFLKINEGPNFKTIIVSAISRGHYQLSSRNQVKAEAIIVPKSRPKNRTT